MSIYSKRINIRFGFPICIALGLAVVPGPSSAFWLLGFAPAETLPSGGLGVIAGTGGQLSRTGDPAKDSTTGFIPHAGFRLGVADGFDLGYRLVQVTLPFTSIGPTLGGEFDAKYRLTDPTAATQFAVVGGLAYAHLSISGQSKNAWSPGVDAIGSRALSEKYTAFSELRYVYTAIPTAQGGDAANNVSASGIATGVKIKLTQQTSLVPEIGIFHLSGKLLGAPSSGNAIQIGAIFSIRIW